GGWSFGGLVALEMALQLTASGGEVALLALFSSYLPRAGVTYPPLRFRDFALEFVRDDPISIGLFRPKPLTKSELRRYEAVRAKQGGLASPEFRLRDFRRVMVEHWRVFRTHVRMGRRYVPEGRVEQIILFEAKEDSTNGRGSHVDWDTAAAHVSRH